MIYFLLHHTPTAAQFHLATVPTWLGSEYLPLSVCVLQAEGQKQPKKPQSRRRQHGSTVYTDK